MLCKNLKDSFFNGPKCDGKTYCSQNEDTLLYSRAALVFCHLKVESCQKVSKAVDCRTLPFRPKTPSSNWIGGSLDFLIYSLELYFQILSK